MSITSVSSGIKPRNQRHGSTGSTLIHGIHTNVEQPLPDESSNPTARISFASDTNFNPKCKSRISRKAKTATINIRPIKEGENTQVTKFQVPKATASSLLQKHCSVTKADAVDSRNVSSFSDYSKTPHYICRENSNISEDNTLNDDMRRSINIPEGHGSLFHGHGGVTEGHCDVLTTHNGPFSDRTHVKPYSSLANERDDLRMLATQNRFACLSHYLAAKTAFWTRPSTDSSNFKPFMPRRPIFRHTRDIRPKLYRGRSFHLDNNESAKRLSHKFKCHECCKFSTNIQNVGWNGKPDSVCAYYDGS